MYCIADNNNIYKGHLSGKDVLGDRQFFMKKMDESEL